MKCSKCERKARSNGLCNSHYVQEWRRSHGLNRKRIVCMNIGCERLTNIEICYFCKRKIKAAENYRDYVPHYSQRGERNCNWNGGVSKYPNHYMFKKNRLIRIDQEHGKCQECGRPFKYVHHIDGNKGNHTLGNLMVLCGTCHAVKHKDGISRPILFSKTLKEMGREMNVSSSTLGKYFKNKNSITRKSVISKIQTYIYNSNDKLLKAHQIKYF